MSYLDLSRLASVDFVSSWTHLYTWVIVGSAYRRHPSRVFLWFRRGIVVDASETDSSMPSPCDTDLLVLSHSDTDSEFLSRTL